MNGGNYVTFKSPAKDFRVQSTNTPFPLAKGTVVGKGSTMAEIIGGLWLSTTVSCHYISDSAASATNATIQCQRTFQSFTEPDRTSTIVDFNHYALARFSIKTSTGKPC